MRTFTVCEDADVDGPVGRAIGSQNLLYILSKHPASSLIPPARTASVERFPFLR
jgi:hypothetical protein